MKRIAVLEGDGIGPEIVTGAVRVLRTVAEKYNHHFEIEYGHIGGAAYDLCGEPLPQATLDLCRRSDAVLLGAVGGNKWDALPPELRPEKALLKLRKSLGLYANLRPAVVFPALKGASPLKASILDQGYDICIVRELTGGIYFGKKAIVEVEKASMSPSGCDGMVKDLTEASVSPDGSGGVFDFIDGVDYEGDRYGYDVKIYGVDEIRRIARKGFEIAMNREKRLTSVDKANVLASSRLWREIVMEVSKEYPEVTLNHMYVDNAAMQLIVNPSQFDVILTGNMFGDIISDEASVITGSIGMLPSASLSDGNFGLYEPIHGSAPDIAGKNISNPIATILSAAMMLRHTFGMEEEAKCIEYAIQAVLDEGNRTNDISENGNNVLGTIEITDLIIQKMLLN